MVSRVFVKEESMFFTVRCNWINRLVLEECLERLVVPVAEVESNGFLVAHATHVHFAVLFSSFIIIPAGSILIAAPGVARFVNKLSVEDNAEVEVGPVKVPEEFGNRVNRVQRINMVGLRGEGAEVVEFIFALDIVPEAHVLFTAFRTVDPEAGAVVVDVLVVEVVVVIGRLVAPIEVLAVSAHADPAANSITAKVEGQVLFFLVVN